MREIFKKLEGEDDNEEAMYKKSFKKKPSKNLLYLLIIFFFVLVVNGVIIFYAMGMNKQTAEKLLNINIKNSFNRIYSAEEK